jgi:ribosome-associated protein
MTSQPLQDDSDARVQITAGVALSADLLKFSFSSSGGPGGQNVNKLATRAQLRVAMADLESILGISVCLRLRRLAGSRVTAAGDLLITDETTRSQHRNRQECLDRFRELVLRALVAPRPRKRTKPSRAARARRLDAKRRRGQTKQHRRPGGDET